MTRARTQLTLSHPECRTRYGDTERCDASRFIAELPERALDATHLAPAVDPRERQKALARGHLAALRNLLTEG
jgi:ATP-dependent DNA helicase Rep